MTASTAGADESWIEMCKERLSFWQQAKHFPLIYKKLSSKPGQQGKLGTDGN